MISVFVVGGDRSSMVDGLAYDLHNGVIFLRFKNTQKWYAKHVGFESIMEAIEVWMEDGSSFGKWAIEKSITKNMTFFSDVDL